MKIEVGVPKLYHINKSMAEEKNIPMYFSAIATIETDRAVYLYGHGTTETRLIGVCCICGRALTHPVSVELGIGPECGQHHHNWDLIGGYTKENLKRLKGALQSIVIDTWIPKSAIQEILDTEEKIILPENKMATSKSDKIVSLLTNRHTDKKALKITCWFSPENRDNIKSLIGRKPVYEEGKFKYWIADYNKENINKLIKWDFQLSQELQNELVTAEKIKTQAIENANNLIVNGRIKIPGLKGTLYSFQEDCIVYLERHNGNAIIGDEQGLGKSIEALAYLQLHPELRPAIIVCPAPLKLNWHHEAYKWMTKPNIQILSGKNGNKKVHGEIIIINYDILPNKYKTYIDNKGKKRKRELIKTGWIDFLIDIKPKIIICDECQYYKNNGTLRTKAIKKLARSIPHILQLSGTPIVNRPLEFFNAIRLIDNGSSGIPKNRFEYGLKFCNAQNNGYGWDFTGASNTDKLHRLITNNDTGFMIRRLKKDVLKDLPDKIRSIVPLEIDNMREYKQAENNFIAWVRKTKGDKAAFRASKARALTEIEGLKQLANKGKLKQVIEWISDFLESDNKLVIFANHKFIIKALMNEFNDIAVKIDGSTNMKARDEAVNNFQNNNKIRLFIGNIKAAGVGITLTAASNVAIIELQWTPGDLEQATDRCHRIGTKYTVNVYFLVAYETIEEKIAELLDRKKMVLDSVLDDKAPEEGTLFHELMELYS